MNTEVSAAMSVTLNPSNALPGTAPKTKLDHALAFAARGFAVFALSENAKTPLPGSNGHHDATTDLESIRAMWTCPLFGSVLPYNIGATPRDGRHLIVDLDVKDGRDGIAAYREMGGELGGLVVSTPSGGRHIYYAASEPIRTGAGKLAPGIDTRGSDGYAVAPGSTIDGVAYEIVEDSGILPLPRFVAEIVGTRAVRPAATTTYAIESDRFANVRRAIRVARAAEPATSGRWHDLGFKLGAEMARIGLSGEMAVRVSERHWQPRGTGFMSRDQFVRDVLDGYDTAVRDREHGKHSVPDVRAMFDGHPVVPPPASNAPADTQAAAPSTTPACPPLLDPAAPMDSALAFIERRHTVAGRRVLCFQGGTFYGWTGTHYAEATREELSAQVWRFLHSAFKQGKNGVWPFNPTTAKVGDVVTATGAACQMPASTRAPSWLEVGAYPAPQGIVACANGLLDLSTGQLRASTPAFFTLNSLPFAYEPNASEPAEWLGFLNTLWPSDPDSRDTLQEIFGLLLTAETRFQKAFLLVGPKRSGKGTIARVLTCLLGQDNVCGPTLGQLGQQFGAAPLIGKRLAIIADARLGGRADAEAVAERILNITGEDSQTIDRKFRDAWTGKLDARLLIISNELPRLSDASGALASRLITLVLTESFYGREDQGLTDRLTDELPGILNWAIAGWRRLAARKRFNPPLASREAQQEMEDLGSPISVFVRERCVVGLDAKARPETLYQAWRFWCAEQGRTQPGTLATFCRDLRAALSTVTRRQETVEGARVWFYGGIGLPSPMRGMVPPPGG